MPEPLTLEELPFDPTFDGTDSNPDDHADTVFAEASEIAGLHVRLLIGITEFVYSHSDDKDKLDALESIFHWKPRYMIRAYERFPELFDVNFADALSWEQIVGAWTLGKVKDEDVAHQLFLDWGANTWDLAQLRDAVKAANGKRERKATLAERCAGIVSRWRTESQVALNVYDITTAHVFKSLADELAALPEVAKVLNGKAQQV